MNPEVRMQLRVMTLELAAKSATPGTPAADVLASAKAFFEYVTGEAE